MRKEDVELGGAGGQEKRRYDPLMETPQRRRPRERGVSTAEVSGAKDAVVNSLTSIGNEVCCLFCTSDE
jgi:hypothetical protein